jgi:transient receptor potential cation channel subfamily C protein 6
LNFNLGNTLPVPMNICPTPKSLIYLMKRIKRMIIPDQLSQDDIEQANRNKDDRLDELNIGRRDVKMHSTHHDKFKHEKIFDRQRSYVIPEKLTYKIVIERIVKRFLLYYKNKHTGIHETNDGLEFKEFKNDISSLRFELLNEIDMVDEMRSSLIQLMKKLTNDLRTQFDFEQIKSHLNNQKN